MLGAVGVSTAYGLITITLAGDVAITENLLVNKDTLLVGELELRKGLTIGDTPQTGVWNSNVPQSNEIITMDSDVVGRASSITIGADGLPIISYQDFTNSNLKVAKCLNISCSAIFSFTLDTGLIIGTTSIAIGTDGFPIISYADGSLEHLKVVKCGDAVCGSGNIFTVVDTNLDSIGESSITIGVDGFPVISYQDNSKNDLKVAKCVNTACTGISTITNVDTIGTVGSDLSIAMGTDGLPIISYHDNSNQQLKVVKCGNAECSSGNIFTAADTGSGCGINTSISVGTDGLPIKSYQCSVSQHLKVLKCGNFACNSGNIITSVDPAQSSCCLGTDSSITIGADGLPIVSYRDNNKERLLVAKCGNSACSSGNTITVVDTNVGLQVGTSITIGSDGLPIISYQDKAGGHLKIAKCGSPFCVSNWTGR